METRGNIVCLIHYFIYCLASNIKNKEGRALKGDLV